MNFYTQQKTRYNKTLRRSRFNKKIASQSNTNKQEEVKHEFVRSTEKKDKRETFLQECNSFPEIFSCYFSLLSVFFCLHLTEKSKNRL